MPRYKRQTKPATNERDFPHLVVMAVPEAASAPADNHETFHRERRRQTATDEPQETIRAFYVTWCFADPADADAFCERFGGERSSPSRSER